MRARSEDVGQTLLLGQALAHALRTDDVVVLCGDLGAGKTHLVKGVAAGLGVGTEVTSPTFNILRQHEGRAGYDDPSGGFAGVEPAPTLAHWDLYRLESSDQLEDVDYFGILESGVISLVEWGDKFEDALPDEYLRVDMTIVDAGSRDIVVSGYGDRGARLAQALRSLWEEA